jgi:hypothetical protein
MPLPTPLATDLERPAVLMFCALQVDLPDGPLRLLDGSGVLAFEVDGETAVFVGRDDVYGTLGALTEIADGVASEAPTETLTLLPKTNAAMAALAAPAAQRSRVRIWVGSVDRPTGLVTDVDEPWFDGETNVPTQAVGKKSRALTIECNSALTNFLQADQGARLNTGFLQKAWPGAKGLQFTNSVLQYDAWGAETQAHAADYAAQQRRILAALGVKVS